jgi:hypothetical protein
LSLLERRAILLLRTDADGTIEVVSEGTPRWLSRYPEIVRGPPVGDEEGER